MDTRKDNYKKFPYEIKDLEPSVNAELLKHYSGEKTGFVRVDPKGFLLPKRYEAEAEEIYNTPIRSSDVFVSSFPRSGTYWTMELVWLVLNNMDYDVAAASTLLSRFEWLEEPVVFHPEFLKQVYEENKNNPFTIQYVQGLKQRIAPRFEARQSPRYVMTHLPLPLFQQELLLDTAKVVYVARYPLDVVVSFYHIHRLFKGLGYAGDFKTFWNLFMNGLTNWSPHLNHVLEAWNKRNHPNMLFLFYEDMKKDLPATVRRVSKFFGKQYSDEEVGKLCEYLSFENFKKNPSVNLEIVEGTGLIKEGEEKFIRKGKAGGWREYFDEEMTAQAEKWIRDTLKDTDLVFPMTS